MEPALEKVLNDADDAASRNLELVRGSQNLSDTMPTVWVTGKSWPSNGEVVTKYSLPATYMLRAFVDCIKGQSTLSFGLIVPDHRGPQMLELRNGEQLQGKLWAWNSKSEQIYRKPFDSRNAFDSAVQIMYHNCKITNGSILSVYRNLKTNTIHFVINGKEQKVSISGKGPDFCYGFLRLSAKGGGSEVRVTLFPVINEAYLTPNVPSLVNMNLSVCRRVFRNLGFAILEVLGLRSLVTSVPVNGNQVQVQVHQEVAKEPELEPEPESAQLSCYEMNRCPRGICLIINNVPNLQHEEQKLVDLFRSLAFDVQRRPRLQKVQIYEVVHEFAKKDHSQFNLFVCILMSVSKQDHQFCDVDGKKVTVEDVTSEYKAKNCPSLKNKPKLFFVQKFAMVKSKLTGNNDRSAQVDGSTVKGGILFSPCATFEEACPEEGDFLLSSVTIPLDEAQLVPESSFIQVLLNVIRQCSHFDHLLEMLVKVNKQLKYTQIGQSDTRILPVQVPYLTHTLRAKVYLGLDCPVVEPLSGPLMNLRGTEQLNQPQQESEEIRDKLTIGRNIEYGRTRRPRGICLILNNINFLGRSEKRDGAEIDERELVTLFKELLFIVHVKRNLRYDEMRNATSNFAKEIDHEKYDAFVLIVMSHGGDRDVIYGVENRVVRVEDLMSEFTEANCPGLRGKPKLFFIQTCRGSLRESMLSTSGNADGATSFLPVDSTLPRSVFPKEPHMLLAFATAPGYVAWRNPESGSLFIQVLVQAIRKLHHREHVLDILTEVTKLVVDIGIEEQETIQVPASTHTLRAQLYL